ncbi:MAG: hypothetical protein MJ054_01990 [Clostridia bacterium]|nr:hypothetical protein [Clostridia bacterium]
MGKITMNEKPKFDLITASKTKKYKIITSIVLVVGILMLIGGILLRTTLTSAVTPNALTINHLSNLDNSTCKISRDESFVISTSTPSNRALATPIIFELDDDAKLFLEVREKTDSQAINSAYYQGLFYLHVLDNAPSYLGEGTTDENRPAGYLTIRCGSKALKIKMIYYKSK